LLHFALASPIADLSAITGKSGKIQKNLLFPTTSNRQLIADNKIKCLDCAQGVLARASSVDDSRLGDFAVNIVFRHINNPS